MECGGGSSNRRILDSAVNSNDGELNMSYDQLPEPWGYPSPLYNFNTGVYENGGIVWHGDEPPTKENFVELFAVTGLNVKIDVATCFGLESFFERNGGSPPYKQEIILG